LGGGRIAYSLRRDPFVLWPLPCDARFLCTGQPLTEIARVRFTVALFCPETVRGMASFLPQRVPLRVLSLASAELERSGSFNSKLEMGASGTVAKVEVTGSP
jgi:hypothetical protein